MARTLTLTRRHKLAIANRSATSNSNRSSLGLTTARTHELIQKVQKGIAYHALETLSHKSGIPTSEFAAVLAIPDRTFARRKSTGRFAPEESERLVRVARIFEQAVDLFDGDTFGAVKWLKTPRKALGNHTPLAYSATELGAREVEILIGQLVHGVFP